MHYINLSKIEAAMNLTRIILSGGQSSRIGKENGLCLLKGKPLIEHAVNLLKNICESIIISANINDYDYLNGRVVKDEESGKDTAGGIYTCLKPSNLNENFVISCNMPPLAEELIWCILHHKSKFDAVVPVFNRFPEPLCAFYQKSCIPVFKKIIETGKNKIQDIIKELNCGFIEINSKLIFYNTQLFTNVNTHEDLLMLEIHPSKDLSSHE
jgi:molybdenum cofactor guanylyltransferase